jgi:glyoxylase-like metal-dependent hydrolase (beta-lactamase superfamily II)
MAPTAPGSIALVLAVIATRAYSGIIDVPGHPDLFFAQLLTGDEISIVSTAENDYERSLFSFGQQMLNFVYLVGSRSAGEAVVFDGAFDPAGIRRFAERNEIRISAFVATHEHWDHIGGGRLRGRARQRVPGADEWIRQDRIPFYIHEDAAKAAATQLGLSQEAITPLRDGDVIRLAGDFELRFVHTPGHSRGSVVTLVAPSKGAALSHLERTQSPSAAPPLFMLTGDTLFPGSCGRLDLDGSSKEAMHASLRKIAGFPDSLEIWPGHGYSAAKSTIGKEKVEGLLRPMTLQQWLRAMR